MHVSLSAKEYYIGHSTACQAPMHCKIYENIMPGMVTSWRPSPGICRSPMREAEKIACLPNRPRISSIQSSSFCRRMRRVSSPNTSKLYRVIAWDQVDGSNTDGSDRRFPTVPVCQQQPGSLGDLHRALAGIAHLHLILVSAQVIAADIQRTPLAARP